MKIGMIAPIWYPIPPKGYGGIELVVSLLADGLVDAGHDVTLFASGDSRTKARLISSYDIAPSALIGQAYPDLYHVLHAYLDDTGEYDIIHDHSGIIGPAIGAFSKYPVLHTLHGPATLEAKEIYGLLDPLIYLNAISNYQKECFGDLNWAGVVYNAIAIDKYPYRDKKEDFLLFLGRMNPEKGPDAAIRVARAAGRKLIMVTKMVELAERRYFDEQVRPLLGDDIQVMGEVDPATKADLFGRAYCTLFPIKWPEPFGLVMIESMAAGTPVVAIKGGAVPEVIEDGKTGFIVADENSMVEAVLKAGEIKPLDCRNSAEERFSSSRMVADYERIYQQIVTKEAAGRHARRQLRDIS